MGEREENGIPLNSTKLKLGEGLWSIGEQTGVVGILNVTPDSFSDGGEYADVELAVLKGKDLADQGADIVDIGGESTRPGYEEVSIDEEISRVVPVISALSTQESFPPISIDTTKLDVARASLGAGAGIVNDVWGFVRDPEMAGLVAEHKASCILMHNASLGWRSNSVLDSIKRFWEESILRAEKAGVEEDRIILDPGIGFTDTRDQDMAILRGLSELRAFGFPLMIGASRKRITGVPMNLSLKDRLESTLATSAFAAAVGVDFVRVHDVRENVRAVRMMDMIRKK